MSHDSDPEGPKDLRTRRREATRLEILEAAQQVFIEVGLHEARMEAIAARAGVSVGTLYNYFDDRDALVEALCEKESDELLLTLEDALADNSKTAFVERLEAFVDATLKHFESNRAFMTALMESGTGNPASPAWSRGTKEAMKELYNRAEKVCAQGTREGVLRSNNAEFYPMLLLGSIRGMMLTSFFKNTGDLSNCAQPLCEFFMHGASARQGHRS